MIITGLFGVHLCRHPADLPHPTSWAAPPSHGSTSFGVIYYFSQPVNKKYEPVSQDDFTTMNVSLRSPTTKSLSWYIKRMVWHVPAVKEYKANQSFMVILSLFTWCCTTGLRDVNDQFWQRGLMETSPLHRGNTSIFDPTLQFGTFMYVKLCLLLFIEAHLVYGSERSAFSCMSAPLQHFMKDWEETRLWVFGCCLVKSYIFSANVI